MPDAKNYNKPFLFSRQLEEMYASEMICVLDIVCPRFLNMNKVYYLVFLSLFILWYPWDPSLQKQRKWISTRHPAGFMLGLRDAWMAFREAAKNKFFFSGPTTNGGGEGGC